MNKMAKTTPTNIEGTVNKAIRESKVAILSYVDAKGKPSVREVECYEIKGDKLYAHCLVRNGIRAFTLSNVSSLKLKDETFTPRF